jgi:hypothetical protein
MYMISISTFLDPNGTRFACCHFRAQKCLDFQVPPSLHWPLKLICPHRNHVYSCKCNRLWQRVLTEWQWQLSGVNSIMMDKLSQPGDVRGMHPLYFIYHHLRSCGVRSSWRSRYSTLPLFLLYPYKYSMVFGKSAVSMCSMTPCAVTVHTVQWALAVIMYWTL